MVSSLLSGGRKVCDMEKVWEIMDRLEDLMEAREYPGSVIQTVIGTIDLADDPLETAKEVEPLVEAAKTPKEVVKAMQPIIRRRM